MSAHGLHTGDGPSGAVTLRWNMIGLSICDILHATESVKEFSYGHRGIDSCTGRVQCLTKAHVLAYFKASTTTPVEDWSTSAFSTTTTTSRAVTESATAIWNTAASTAHQVNKRPLRTEASLLFVACSPCLWLSACCDDQMPGMSGVSVGSVGVGTSYSRTASAQWNLIVTCFRGRAHLANYRRLWKLESAEMLNFSRLQQLRTKHRLECGRFLQLFVRWQLSHPAWNALLLAPVPQVNWIIQGTTGHGLLFFCIMLWYKIMSHILVLCLFRSIHIYIYAF